MKIIILGGGICGLSTLLALRKHFPSATVTVWETYSSPRSTNTTIGGGLGLAPNGLRALSHLSPSIATYITSRGFEHAGVTFYNSRGKQLGEMMNGRKSRYGFEQTLVARGVVHMGLLEQIGEDGVVWGRQCVGVQEVDGGVEVRYNDGGVEGTEMADMVLGCDGVRSNARRGCVDDSDAVYQGLSGTGGFLPVSALPNQLQKSLETEPVVMAFGSNGFFGYSLCTSDKSRLQWWSTWETVEPPVRDALLSEIRDSLLSRHGDWVLPHDGPDHRAIKSIILAACGSEGPFTVPAVERGVLILPVYVLPRLPRWGCQSGRIMLLGDASHAVPPDSGQGVALAAEDAVAFALLLKHHGGFRTGLKSDFEELRMPRIHKILDFAKKMGDQKRTLSGTQEWFRDAAMWVVCKLPESFADSRFAYDAEKEVEKFLAKKK